MNFRKSLLSLAALAALSNTATADTSATYLPLSSSTADSSWILFGVNGFSTGVPTVGAASAPSEFTLGYTQLTEASVVDDLATSGLASVVGGNEDLASLQEIASLADLSIAMDITTDSIPFIAEEPVRTMYIALSKTGTPEIKFNYKASLEGRAIEILVGTTIYSTTVSQDSVYRTPARAEEGLAPVIEGTDPNIKSVVGVLDFTASDNPVNPKDYNATAHLDDTGVTSSFYHFNAITQQWEVNQKGAAIQDFTEFNAGKAYWGRIDKADALGTQINDGDGAGSLILGTATQASNNLPNPDVYQDDDNVSTLTIGWNMLSFDDSEPYIRHSATGLVLSGIADNDVITITDDSKLHSITTAALTAATLELDAIAINKQIESAKLRGLLPETFNVKAFANGVDGELILLSDKKFYVGASTGAAIDVKTLTDANPYVDGIRTTAVTDLEATTTAGSNTSVESVYGEYAVVFKPLVGAEGVAADGEGAGGFGFSKVTYWDATNGTETKVMSGAATVASVSTILPGNLTSAVVGTQIDTDYDGASDMVLLANATEPFSLADGVFTRVFAHNDATTGGGDTDNLTLLEDAPTTVATVNADAAIDLADDIDGKNIATLRADDDSADTTKLVVFSVSKSTFDLKDAEDTTKDYLEEVTSGSDIAKGAISGVYSLDDMARKDLGQVTDVITSVTTNAAGSMGDADDTFAVTIIDNTTVAPIAMSGITGVVGQIDTYGEMLALFDAIVAETNTLVTANNQHAYATHSYTIPNGITATTALPASASAYVGEVTVVGVDVLGTGSEDFGVAFADGGTTAVAEGTSTNAAATGDNLLDLADGNLVKDLKTNAVYTPNYAVYGPLYTLRESGEGYNVRAMLKATTDLDTATGTALTSPITWDSIDLTRNEEDWFANNEFNLFNVNHNSGYWVYLEEKSTTNDMVISNASESSKGYTYYFSNDKTSTPALQTTNIINSYGISVDVSNVDSTSSAGSVYAIIGGEEIQLSNTTGDTYTGNVGKYALDTFTVNTIIPVKIRAVNGKGVSVELEDAILIDYVAPTNVVGTINGTNLELTSDGNNTTDYYVFKDYISEVDQTNTLVKNIDVDANSTQGSMNVCTEFDYGTTNTLRIAATDGDFYRANVSTAIEVIYANLTKDAQILSHTQGVGLKAQLGDVYNSNCTVETDQVADGNTSANFGVSLATITTGQTTKLSVAPLANASFNQDVAWTSNYTVDSGNVKIQVQNTTGYAGKAFYIEYSGKIYNATFPASQAAADATIGTPTALTAMVIANKTLVP